MTPTRSVRATAARHLRFGWWSLLAFLTLGLVLESLHGLKLDLYLAVGNETRRLLWTLGHAHGALLAILNVVFGLAARDRDAMEWSSDRFALASRCLFAASVLLPGGFLLGGFGVQGGDPGLGVLLAPPGAVLLFVAVFLAARSAVRDEA